MADYLHGGYRDRWLTIGLVVMATQASAITFLSMPGQAYEDGMRFVQFYFGLPIAMVVLSVAFMPRFYRLRVLTAYEYLEGRFDLKTRQLAAFLFLLQRGLSAGITIYAPAIVLSKVLGWSLNLTCLVIGGAGHPLHGGGRHARGQPDAEAPDGGDAGRDGGGLRGDRPPAAARPVVRPRGVAGRDAGQDERRRLLARSRQPLHASGRAWRAAASWRWPTSGPISRRCSATSRGARSPRAAWACCSTACSRSRCSS